jgi:hypothetical protein
MPYTNLVAGQQPIKHGFSRYRALARIVLVLAHSDGVIHAGQN